MSPFSLTLLFGEVAQMNYCKLLRKEGVRVESHRSAKLLSKITYFYNLHHLLCVQMVSIENHFYFIGTPKL